MVQEENHPQLSGTPASAATRRYVHATSPVHHAPYQPLPASSRVRSTVNCGIFQRLTVTPVEGKFLQNVIGTHAAAGMSKTSPVRPVPDLKLLQSWATRRRAKHRAVCSSNAEE
ncbi:hypothetical protein MRX96_043850 [Rhipicephalus microplus]